MDHHYARDKLELLLRDLGNYSADEFSRQMSRITAGATGRPEASEQIATLERQVEDRDKEIIALSSPERVALHNPDHETYRQPFGGWVCFHCGDTLKTPKEARAHFGETPQALPRCLDLAARVQVLEEQLSSRNVG